MAPLHQLLPGHRAAVALRIAGLCVLFFLAALVLCLFWWIQNRDDSLEKIRRHGALRVGYAVEEPYAFIARDGKVTGAFPEMAVQIAKELGISRVEWRLTDFHLLIESLESGRIDVIAAGMFNTPERLRRVDFSLPAFKARPGLLVQKGNPHRLHAYADLKADGSIRTAVIWGSAEEADLARAGIPPGRLIRTPNAHMGQLLIASGQAEALALSLPTLQWMLSSGNAGETEIAVPFERGGSGGEVDAPQYSAFAFRKNDNALRKAWNRVMERYVGSPGQLETVRPFGFSEADLPALAKP